MIVVAFGQQSRVGKDTAAKMLVSLMRLSNKYKKGVKKKAFASLLKQGAYEAFKQYGLKDEVFYEEEGNKHLRSIPLPTILKTPVQIWIEYGMKCREIYEHVWRDAVLMDDTCDAMVISDYRFKNEGDGVADLHGIRVHIKRPNCPVNASDTQDLEYDEVIANEGTIIQLQAKIEAFAIRRGLI